MACTWCVRASVMNMYRFVSVHPIERLRYVARTNWAGPSMLAAEAAWALADLADHEAPALVPACRRLLDRQPGCGPLWWVAARVLGGRDPVREAEICADELEDDPTRELVEEVVPPGARAGRRGGIAEVASADLVVVEVDALAKGGMVVNSSGADLIRCARAVEVPLWLEAGVGRVLPQRLWGVMASRMERGAHSLEARPGVLTGQADSWDLPGSDVPPARTVMDLAGVETVVCPEGARPLRDAISSTDCPEPPELLEAF
jgi:hypothetical protein